MPGGLRDAEVDHLAGEEDVLDAQRGGVGRRPVGDLPAERAIGADRHVDGVRVAVGVGVVVGVLDVAGERRAAANVGDAEQFGDQVAGVVGGRRQPARAGGAVAGRDAAGSERVEGGDGAVGGGELGLVGAGGVSRPGGPVTAGGGDPVGLGGGAGEVEGAGVRHLGVVAVVELPAAAVGRTLGAASPAVPLAPTGTVASGPPPSAPRVAATSTTGTSSRAAAAARAALTALP